MNEKKSKDSAKEPDIKMKSVHEVWGPVEAEVVKTFLESHGISCIFSGLVVQSVHAFSADGLGRIKILVSENDYERAKQLIKNR